jgi:hypothetical protein
MNDIIKIADYIVALQHNNVTDEVRDNFASIITDELMAIEKFALVITNILKNVPNKFSAEEAFNLIRTEYNNLPFPQYLGNLNNYVSFIELLLSTKATLAHEMITIDILKNYINAADNTSNETVKAGIYNAVLSTLLHGQFIADNLEFTEYIIDYIKSYGQMFDAERVFSEIVLNVLNN